VALKNLFHSFTLFYCTRKSALQFDALHQENLGYKNKNLTVDYCCIVDHSLLDNWSKLVAAVVVVVDIEDNTLVVVYRDHLMLNIVDRMKYKNVILVVYFAVLDHRFDKHAFDDYFQCLMFLIIH
jgi:hypothetical protein